MVVDPLWGLVELGRHLGARAGLGELPQHFDPLGLEQGLGLLDLIEVDDISHGKTSLYVKEALVNGPRIPLGTVVLEEFAFRGVLLGLLARMGPMKTAVAVSSLLFGLWHMRPTLGTLATNDLAQSAWAQVGAVTAAVALTTVGGLLFCALRLASGSLVAPLIVHTATNSAAIVTIYVTDVAEYRASLGELGGVYRRHFGHHYPAMALLGVRALFDDAARIELVGVAVIPSFPARASVSVGRGGRSGSRTARGRMPVSRPRTRS